MWEKIKNLIWKRGFEASIYAILVLLVLNSALVLYYRQVINENVKLQGDLLEIRTGQKEVEANINRADMAVRGYLLVPEESMVLPYHQSVRDFPNNIGTVESLLQKHGYKAEKIVIAKNAIVNYLEVLEDMIQMVNNGNSEQALETLQKDPGYDAWQTYYPIMTDVTAFVTALEDEANQQYQAMIRNTWISQLVFLLIAVPFLVAVARRLRRSQINRKRLFKTLNENKNKYLFDDQSENGSELNEDSVIAGLASNLQKASHFINNITDGNYNISWEGLNEENWHVNENTLSGELTKMRDQMIKVKKEDEKRLWTTEGLSKFGEIIRNYQNNISTLSDHLISQLVKYLGAKQGGLFILNEENEYDKFLELTGCYAYERKKYLNKKLPVGDGLVGQCFLEREYIYLKNVPEDYVMITSGLGEANPSSLLLVPLKNENTIIGVIEIASLVEFQDHQIEFVNHLSESIASAIETVKINEKTNDLLERTQQQAEEMRAQEEEMRQNMEELQATQESLHRESQEKEKVQAEVEKTKTFLQKVINALPDPIFVKDRDHKFVILNDAVCQFNGWKREEVLGKTDLDLFSKEEAKKMYEIEEQLFESNKDVEEEMEATRNGKKTVVIDKKRIIKDEEGNSFIVGINIDISQLKKIERDLAKEKYLLDAMLDNIPDSIYFKDEKSRFIRVSKSMVDSFGFSSSEELMGKTDFDFQDEEHAQQAFNDELEIMKSQKPMIDMVEKETFEDGTVRWVSTTKMPLKDLNNKVVGTFGISRDISKLKNMEIGYKEEIENFKRKVQEKDDEIKRLKNLKK